jgi:hypothetical protein
MRVLQGRLDLLRTDSKPPNLAKSDPLGRVVNTGLSDVFEEYRQNNVKGTSVACDCPCTVDDREAGVILRMLLPRKRIEAAPGEWIIIDRESRGLWPWGWRCTDSRSSQDRVKLCQSDHGHAIRERQDEAWLAFEDSLPDIFFAILSSSLGRVSLSRDDSRITHT